MGVNGTLIRNNKGAYVKEVASMKAVEVFGVEDCGVTWHKLFRKHLAMDVLQCGGLSCDAENCLKGEIEKDCNC